MTSVKMTLGRTSCAALALARKKRGFCFARAARPVGVLPTERRRHVR